MSVILNEAALTFLLESPAGPVGQDLRRRAENVAAIYDANVYDYLPEFREQGGLVSYEIVSGDDGLQATIGIIPGGGSSRFAENIATKVLKEPEKATDALQVGLHL